MQLQHLLPAAAVAAVAAAGLTSATMSFNSTISDSDTTYWSAVLLPSAPISAACAGAYAASVPCDDMLLRIQSGSLSESDVFTQPVLSSLCADSCIAGLRSWRDALRADCSADDKAAVAAAEEWAGSEQALFAMDEFLNETMHMAEYMFYATCLKDLPTDTFCYLLPSNDSFFASPYIANDTSPSSPEGQAFCNSSCSTQLSLWLTDIVAATVPDADTSDQVDAAAFCPGLDTSKYPFLDETSSSSSGSGPSSSKNGTAAGGNSTLEGAAGRVGAAGGAAWGLVALVGAVAAGLAGL